MSTKIYYAYRVKKSRFIEFLDLAHDQMFELALGHVKESMKTIRIDEEKYKKDIEKYAPNNKRKQARMRKWRQFDAVMKHCEKASQRMERDFHDVDCGLNIWLHGHHAYVIPIGPYWILDNIKFPKWVEDYSYWNNTDPPKSVTERQWGARRDTWDKICTGHGKSDHNARRLYHGVIDLERRGSYVSHTELQMRLFPRG
jgi:hypothetical protein